MTAMQTSGFYTHCCELHEQGLFSLREPICVTLVLDTYVGRLSHKFVRDIAKYLVPENRRKDPVVNPSASHPDHVEFKKIPECVVSGCVFYRKKDGLLISYSSFDPLTGNGGNVNLLIYHAAWPSIVEEFT